MQVGIILKAPEFTDTVKEEKVIYCDGAYKFKDKIGEKQVVAVVGDFDSLGAPPIDQTVFTLNPEKNFTDGEYALTVAKEKGLTEVTIYGAYGGKIEHVLGTIALLKIAKNLNLTAIIKDGNTVTRLIDGKVNLIARKGSTLSLIPYGESCSFVKSSGLYYPLDNLTLTNADTRGVSNVVTNEEVQIEFEKGQALVIFEE